MFPLHATGSADIETPENAEAVIRIAEPGVLIADLPVGGSGEIPGLALTVEIWCWSLDTEECTNGESERRSLGRGFLGGRVEARLPKFAPIGVGLRRRGNRDLVPFLVPKQGLLRGCARR